MGRNKTVLAGLPQGIATPTGIAFDGAGNLLVADYLRSTVMTLSLTGSGVTPFADEAGASFGRSMWPTSIRLPPALVRCWRRSPNHRAQRCCCAVLPPVGQSGADGASPGCAASSRWPIDASYSAAASRCWA